MAMSRDRIETLQARYRAWQAVNHAERRATSFLDWLEGMSDAGDEEAEAGRKFLSREDTNYDY